MLGGGETLQEAQRFGLVSSEEIAGLVAYFALERFRVGDVMGPLIQRMDAKPRPEQTNISISFAGNATLGYLAGGKMPGVEAVYR